MPRFLLVHRHDADHCEPAWAAWSGHPSPLRGTAVACSCVHGGHSVWWDVQAADADAALALLPRYVAETAEALPVRRFVTP